MASIATPTARHAPWAGYGAVGAILGFGVWYALWCIAAFFPGAYHETVQNALLRLAFWPYAVLLHGDIAGPETNNWQDLVPFVMSAGTWMGLGAGVALGMCCRRSRTADDNGLRAGKPAVH